MAQHPPLDPAAAAADSAAAAAAAAPLADTFSAVQLPDVGPSATISLRALVTSKEAGIIIGRGGQHVAELREKTGVKAGVSKVVPRVPRVLTVSGTLEAVAQALGLIAQAFIDQKAASSTNSTPSTTEATLVPPPPSAESLANEATTIADAASSAAASVAANSTPTAVASSPALDASISLPPTVDGTDATSSFQPTLPLSGTTNLRLLVSHALMGAVIGKQGATIRTIQEESGTRMVATKEMLPNSTERIVDITGTAASIEKAILDIGKHVAAEWDRAPGTVLFDPEPDGAAGLAAGMPFGYGAPGTRAPMQDPITGFPGMPAWPQHGIMAPAAFGSMLASPATASYAAHVASLQHQHVFAPTGIPAGSATSPSAVVTAASQGAAIAPGGGFVAGGMTGQGPMSAPAVIDSDKMRTQNIAIPEELVGCIIGKNGSKITEIRRLSGSRISIAKVSHDETGDRLFTIQGTPASNEKALFLLFNQLETETERRKTAAAAQEPPAEV